MDNTGMFSGDAFELESLIKAINDVDHIPGRAGQLAFQGVSAGVSTLDVVIERDGDQLHLIPTSARGGPAPKLVTGKRSVIEFKIPHIQTEDTLYADSVQGIRAFGTVGELMTVEGKLQELLTKMARRLDFTLEHHRLGALMGIVKDADGDPLVNLYESFGFLNSVGVAGPEVFDFGGSEPDDIRITAQKVVRYLRRNVKTILPPDATVVGFCGDNYFDKLISRDDVKAAYKSTSAAAERLGGNYAFGTFEYGGIVWENYQGSDDATTIAIPTDECRFFFSNVPQLYSESYAPAEYGETVNTIGLPRYAKAEPGKFNKYVEIEAQMNPLPLCVRPATLARGVI